jgi:hypothetical protein
MSPVTCRSPLEIAEDLLMFATKQFFNVSSAEAVRYHIQKREIGAAVRVEAEQLLLDWEGTYFQQTEAYRLHNLKVSLLNNCKY